jgi:hypothetical protein
VLTLQAVTVQPRCIVDLGRLAATTIQNLGEVQEALAGWCSGTGRAQTDRRPAASLAENVAGKRACGHLRKGRLDMGLGSVHPACFASARAQEGAAKCAPVLSA